MFKKLFILLTCVIGLTACATPYDADIAISNNSTIQNHDTQQSNAVSHKTTAIAGIFDKISSRCKDTDSFACGALLGMSGAMASRDIASIETKEYSGPTQKTGIDAQIKVLETVQNVANPVVTGVVAFKAIDKDKGVVNNNASGDNSSASSNYDEDHATSFSADNGSAESTNSPSGNHEEIIETPVAE